MTQAPPLFIRKIRHLSIALIISGLLNIGVLSFLIFWMLKERPPTPYCELKPARVDQQEIPLADQRGSAEVLTELSQLSFDQLIDRLSHSQLIENGFEERDLAFAVLVAFHHFDMDRALSKNTKPQQKRLLAWKPKSQQPAIELIVYPDLTQKQFEKIIHFARTERWPLTSEGLFLLLKEQRKNKILEKDLIETFILTPDFWTVELLFNSSVKRANRDEILATLLDGEWSLLKQFVDQQRSLHDSSDARRHKFLLEYLKVGSTAAAQLLLKTAWDFTSKKLDDQHVITILKLMPNQLPESVHFAKEMLASPRSQHVWQEAASWLYAQSGESLPKVWNYEEVMARFIPEKTKVELISQAIVVPPKSVPLSLPRSDKEVKKVAVLSSPKPAPTSKVDNNSVKKERIHIVQQKDSLWKISKQYGVKIEDIKKENGLKSDILKPGTVLKISNQKNK